MDKPTFKALSELSENLNWGQTEFDKVCELLCTDDKKRTEFATNLTILVKNSVSTLPECSEASEISIFGSDCGDKSKAMVSFLADDDFKALGRTFLPKYMDLINDKMVCEKLMPFYDNNSKLMIQSHMNGRHIGSEQGLIKFNWFSYCILRSMIHLRRHAESAIAREERDTHAPMFTQVFVELFENNTVRDGVSKGLAPVMAGLFAELTIELKNELKKAVFEAHVLSAAAIVEAVKKGSKK